MCFGHDAGFNAHLRSADSTSIIAADNLGTSGIDRDVKVALASFDSRGKRGKRVFDMFGIGQPVWRESHAEDQMLRL